MTFPSNCSFVWQFQTIFLSNLSTHLLYIFHLTACKAMQFQLFVLSLEPPIAIVVLKGSNLKPSAGIKYSLWVIECKNYSSLLFFHANNFTLCTAFAPLSCFRGRTQLDECHLFDYELDVNTINKSQELVEEFFLFFPVGVPCRETSLSPYVLYVAFDPRCALVFCV